MSEIKQAIRDLIEDNVSAIQIMSNKTGVTENDVVALLQEMLVEGYVKGHLSDDGKRFFREDAKVSDRPVVTVEETPPPFMRYDARPGKVAAFFGLLIFTFGAILLSLAQDFAEQNLATSIMLVGMIVILLGCYQIGRRNAP
ncbi:MAG: hypothetical protein EAX95_16555 [Candidatus Thorarchaeota archaeon]|nr:hypothetical protein [Candidatus Thorarchaeota archaeon]